MDTEIWISAPFHVLQNVILLFSTLLFKNAKAILSLWTVHFFAKGSEPDTANKNRTLVKFEFQINSEDAFSINMFLVIFGTYLY